ncbi:MAG: hypothetical protein U0234_11100 [Sandaracinus sp.]
MRRALSIASCVLALSLAACGSPASDTDAALVDAATVDAAVPHGIRWAMGPALPTPLAYATAVVLGIGETDYYVYVFGGSSALRNDLVTISSAVYRSRIEGDSLGPWEPMGDIAPGGVVQGLVGHGALPIRDAMGNPGATFGGGGSSSGTLPVILAVYADPTDGHLFDWSRYPQVLADGQLFGAFVPVTPFDDALVGGLVHGTYSDRVVIASTRNGETRTTWTDGPSLPEPRARQSWVLFHNAIYLVGGENDGGPVGAVTRTTLDTAGNVTGWEHAGSIASPPVAGAAFVRQGELWLVGGVEGRTFDGAASTHVRHGAFDGDGQVGAFEDADPLPLSLAASALATDFTHYFLVGGQTGADLEATDQVVIGTAY